MGKEEKLKMDLEVIAKKTDEAKNRFKRRGLKVDHIEVTNKEIKL